MAKIASNNEEYIEKLARRLDSDPTAKRKFLMVLELSRVKNSLRTKTDVEIAALLTEELTTQEEACSFRSELLDTIITRLHRAGGGAIPLSDGFGITDLVKGYA